MTTRKEIGVKTCHYAGMEMLLVDIVKNENLPYCSNTECYTYEGENALRWLEKGEYALWVASKNKPKTEKAEQKYERVNRTCKCKNGTISMSNSRSSIEISSYELVDYITKQGELKERTKNQYINLPAEGIPALKEVIAAYEADNGEMCCDKCGVPMLYQESDDKQEYMLVYNCDCNEEEE